MMVIWSPDLNPGNKPTGKSRCLTVFHLSFIVALYGFFVEGH